MISETLVGAFDRVSIAVCLSKELGVEGLSGSKSCPATAGTDSIFVQATEKGCDIHHEIAGRYAYM